MRQLIKDMYGVVLGCPFYLEEAQKESMKIEREGD